MSASSDIAVKLELNNFLCIFDHDKFVSDRVKIGTKIRRYTGAN